MSIRIMSAIWEIPLPPTEKLVLLALADAANDEGLCWPSIATIARKSGFSERSVQRSIRAAEGMGLITREEVIGKGCKYRLIPRQSGTGDRVAPVTETTKTPDTVAPNPSRTTIPKKAKASLGTRKTRLPADFEPVLTDAIREIVSVWPPGMLQRELAQWPAPNDRARQH
jgi:DNA-binding Lrp family transcriptional regulator